MKAANVVEVAKDGAELSGSSVGSVAPVGSVRQWHQWDPWHQLNQLGLSHQWDPWMLIFRSNHGLIHFAQFQTQTGNLEKRRTFAKIIFLKSNIFCPIRKLR